MKLTVKPRFFIHCSSAHTGRFLSTKLGERLLAENFDVELNFEASLDPDFFARKCREVEVAIVDLGSRRENVELFPLRNKSAKIRNPIYIALAEKNQDLALLPEVLQIDRVFPLPLDLRLFIDESKRLLKSRGIALARKYPRSPTGLTVGVRPIALFSESPMRLLNISEGGFSMEGSYRGVRGNSPKIGERIHFTLHRGNRLHGPVRGLGQVRWVTPVDEQNHVSIGVEFGTLFNLNGLQLRQFIELYQSPTKQSPNVPGA